MSLRNCILIALATDATPEEYEHAHQTLDLLQQHNSDFGVDPAVLINETRSASAPTTPNSGPQVGAATTAAPAAAAGGVQLDAAGLPWDERIHSSLSLIHI